MTKNPNYERDYKTHDRYRARLKAKAHAHLGSKCVKCGFDDPRALQFDHVNGGGLKHIRETNMRGQVKRYLHVLSTIPGEFYQLLCANCNWIKRFENDEN